MAGVLILRTGAMPTARSRGHAKQASYHINFHDAAIWHDQWHPLATDGFDPYYETDPTNTGKSQGMGTSWFIVMFDTFSRFDFHATNIIVGGS
jgi:hypothetical protein